MTRHEDLKAAIDKWRKLPFPDHAEGDELEDWLFDLLAYDGYVAGLAIGGLGGGPQKPNDETVSLAERLEQIEPANAHDEAVKASACEYLAALSEVVHLANRGG